MNDNYYNNVINRINNMVTELSNKAQSIKNRTLETINNDQNLLYSQVQYAQQKLTSVFDIIHKSNDKLQSAKSNIDNSLANQFTGLISATSLNDVLNRFSVTKNLQGEIVSQSNSNVPHETIASYVKSVRPDLTQAHVSDIILASAISNGASIPKSQSMVKSFADQQMAQKIAFQQKKAALDAQNHEMMKSKRAVS